MPTDSATVAHTPISTVELEHLSVLLERYGDPDSGLSLEGLDGFFSAMAVGPGLVILADEYLPEILDCEPRFESRDDAFHTAHLLMRLNNHVAWRLAAGMDDVEPDVQPRLMMPVDNNDQPLEPIPDDFPLGAAWALGFMRAAQLRAADWQAWCATDDGIASDFSRIVDLTLVVPEPFDDVALAADLGLPALADRELIVAELGHILLNMARRRHEDSTFPDDGVSTAEAGTESCACGSGRPYTSCCAGRVRSLN